MCTSTCEGAEQLVLRGKFHNASKCVYRQEARVRAAQSSYFFSSTIDYTLQPYVCADYTARNTMVSNTISVCSVVNKVRYAGWTKATYRVSAKQNTARDMSTSSINIT